MTVTVDIAALFALLVGLLFIVLGGGIIWMFVLKIRRFIASRHFEGLDRENMRRRWHEIEKMVEGEGEMSLKIAVLESDKLLDHALKSRKPFPPDVASA